MPFQDDVRETELIELFKLRIPDGRTRGGIDAELVLDGSVLPFEVKSASKGSVTTVRDFGPDHVRKWRGKHWLIGFYKNNRLSYSLYGSPAAMDAWISEKAAYISTDFALAQHVPPLLTMTTLDQVLGTAEEFTVKDARKLHKKQYSAAQYKELCDTTGTISSKKMLEVLRDRCRYLIVRGSTLNNPHIPASYFEGWSKITSDHPNALRRMVRAALKREP